MSAASEAKRSALEKLRSKIEEVVSRDRLELADLPIGEEVGLVLQDAIPVRKTSVGWSADGSGVLLAGSVDLGDGKEADLRATFAPAGNATACRLFVTLAEATEWGKEDSHFPFDAHVTAFELSSTGGSDFAFTLWAEIDGGSDDPIGLTLELPGPDGQWVFHAEPGGVPVTISRVAELLHFDKLGQSFPWAFDAIGLTDLSVSFTPEKGISLVSCAFASTDTNGGFHLFGDRTIDELIARVMVREPLGNRAVDLYLAGLFQLGNESVLLEAQRSWDPSIDGASGWTFVGTIPEIEVSDLLDRLGLSELPDGFPSDISLRDLRLSATPAEKMFSLQGSVKCEWSPLGAATDPVKADLTLEKLECRFAGDEPQFDIGLRLHAKSPDQKPLEVGDFLAVRDLNFMFSLKSESSRGEEWTVDATVTVDVLQAKNRVLTGTSHRGATGVQRITLAERGKPADGDLSVSIGPGKLGLDGFGFWLELGRHNGRSAVTDIGIDGAGHLTVGDLGLRGDLHLERKTNEKGEKATYELKIVEKVDRKPRIKIPVPELLTKRHLAVQLQKWDLGLARSSDEWSISGGLQVTLLDFPSPVTTEPSTGTITLSKEGCTLGVSKLIKPIKIPLKIDRGDGKQPLDLGSFSGNAENLTLIIGAESIDLSTKLSLALPDHLNRLFCWDDTREPPNIFAFGPDNPLEVRVGLGTRGASLKLLRLPIRRWFKGTEHGEIHAKLGDAGTIIFALPELTFKEGSFGVPISVREDPRDELRVPLTPFKRLLGSHRGETDGGTDESDAAKRRHAIADILPDSIPLKRPKLYDEKHGLRVHVLVRHLKELARDVAGDDHPGWGKLEDALGKLEGATEDLRLPARFVEYLEADRPSGLTLTLQANPSGAVNVKFAVEPAVYLLIPQLMPPRILGLKLTSFTFGEVLAGALFLLEVDAEFDTFDLLPLAASVVASKEKWLSNLLPELDKTRNTLFLDGLTMFIIYETAIPIPIPIFYERLGFEYRGFEGIAIAASARFDPLADNDIVKVFQTAGDLRRFLTDSSYALPTDGTSGISATFSLRKTFLITPPYLGNEHWGSEKDGDLWSVDFVKVGATILNSAKFFSIRDVLYKVASEHRCGALDLTLGPIHAGVGWLATTQAELERGVPEPKNGKDVDEEARKLIARSHEASDKLLAVFRPPAELESVSTPISWPVPSDKHGLIFVMWSSVGFSNWFEVSTTVGLAASGEHGIATFAQLESSAGEGAVFKNGLSFRLACLMDIDFEKKLGKGAATFAVVGGFYYNDEPLLQGTGVVGDQRIELTGHLSLFDQITDHLELTTEAIARLSGVPGEKGLLISAKGKIKLWGMDGTGDFTLTQHQFSIKGEGALGASSCSVEVLGIGPNPAGLGSMAIDGDLTVEGLSGEAARAVTNRIQRAVDGLQQKIRDEWDYDSKQWPWKKKHPFRTNATWEAMVLCAGILESAVDGEISAALREVIDWVLAYLPGPIARPVKWIQENGRKIENLVSVSGAVKISGTLDLAKGGKATLEIKNVRYMGQSFPDFSKTVSLDPADVLRTVANAVAAHLVGA